MLFDQLTSCYLFFFFFSSRRRHTRCSRDWSSDVCSSDLKANHGHACIKGRFAWGYATHSDRVLKPMIRETIRDEWREVSWEEAIGYAASEIRRVQTKYGRDSVGGITSSRCTNEETFLVQKLVRAALGHNKLDTCAPLCPPTTG